MAWPSVRTDSFRGVVALLPTLELNGDTPTLLKKLLIHPVSVLLGRTAYAPSVVERPGLSAGRADGWPGEMPELLGLMRGSSAMQVTEPVAVTPE